MTYPPQGDNAGQGSYGETPNSYGQSPYGRDQGVQGQETYGQGTYGQTGTFGQASSAQDPYGQSGFGAQPAAYPGFGGGIDMRPERPGPPSNVGWAVAAILFFWPLAFTAMTRAIDVYPLWAAGRYEEAEAASATAKKLGIAALCVAAGILVLYMIFVFMILGMAASFAP